MATTWQDIINAASTLLARWKRDVDFTSQIVNGPATGDGSTVATDGGTIPTFAKTLGDAAAESQSLRSDLANSTDPAKGAALVARAVARVDAITLASATGLRDGDVIYAKGRSAAGDNGGGAFVYNASSTATPDGGLIFAPVSGSGRFIRDGWSALGFNGPINPKWFGAKGDGVTNDSAAIQAAIDYVSSLNGGDVAFQHGTYVCNVIAKSGVTLRSGSQMYAATFNGFSNVTLKQGASGFVVDTPDTLVSGIGIQGINFMGLGAGTPGGGVKFRNVKWSAIKQCCFNNFADQAMLHLAGFAVVFEDILTVNTLLNRTRTQISGCLESYGTDNFINRCELNPSLTGLVDTTNMYICGLVLGGANSFVSNVVGEFCERGIYVAPVDGTGHRIVAVRGDSNFGWGIYNDGSAQWMGCFAYHNSTGNPGFYSGFYSSTLSNGNKYIGCQSDGVSGTNIKNGFEDPSGWTDPNAKNDYVSCTSLYNQSGAFALNSTSGAGVVFSSKATSPANGTTNPSVSGVTIVNLSGYTSATTITNFINPAAGQTIRVLGDANVTLANGSGINTPTGANYPLADGTMYTLTYIAGFWRM